MPSANQILSRFIQPKRLRRFSEVLRARTDDIVLVLEDVHDPHNIGAVLRSCDAFGVQRVILIGKSTHSNPARKVAQGTERWLTVERYATAAEAIDALRREKYEIAVAVKRRGGIAIGRLRTKARLALWFGNEHDGASETAIAAADVHAWIPLVGMVESLNISVAAAISLYAVTENRRRGLPRALSAKLRAEWTHRDVRGADAILRRFNVK
jgi:tRNA (guanosine-2'-O-)-methyltransferase